MAAQKKKKVSIQSKLSSMVLLPIIGLSIMIVGIGMVLLYQSYAGSIQDELEAVTNILLDCLELSVRGDYSYEKGMLSKGDANITDSTMLYRIKETSNIDSSIFWKDTRVLTTVQDQYGISAMGTKADPKVTEKVLNMGNDYFSNNLDINGVPYIGYYRPLRNSDDRIVGMIFAGKQKSDVYNKVGWILLWFMLFSLIAALAASIMSRFFSTRMVSDISMINTFLKTIAEDDLNAEINDRIVQRNDELGSIGLYAAKMRNALRNTIETDPLTSLYNRRSCNSRLQALEDEKERFSVVMCDIDFFKKINDTYGHEAGDYVLVTISDMLRDNLRDCGFASRWGGEEFLLIYKLDAEKTKKKVETLQQLIRDRNFTYDGNSLKVTMTFGVETGNEREPYEERIKKADDKLYIGKKAEETGLSVKVQRRVRKYEKNVGGSSNLYAGFDRLWRCCTEKYGKQLRGFKGKGDWCTVKDNRGYLCQ